MSITPLSHSATMRKRATWMSAVPQDRTLFDLTLPGTHHSASCSISSSSFSTAICRRNAQCQSLTITQQLHAGVRSFDVRLRLGSTMAPAFSFVMLPPLHCCPRRRSDKGITLHARDRLAAPRAPLRQHRRRRPAARGLCREPHERGHRSHHRH
jgi:hypothetical protein